MQQEDKSFTKASCRSCGTQLEHTFVDLGMSPLCESYVSREGLNQMEPFYPLHVYVCHNCFLVQLEEYVKVEDIFSEYAYFSSYSDSWLEHAKKLYRYDRSAFGSRSAKSGHGIGQQRWLSTSVFR